MTHVTCRLTAKNWDQLRSPTLCNRVWATFYAIVKGKGGPYSIAEHRVSELIPVLGSQPAGDVSQARSYPRNPYYQFCCFVNRGMMGVNSLSKTVTRQHRGCDLNPGPSAPEWLSACDSSVFPMRAMIAQYLLCLYVCHTPVFCQNRETYDHANSATW